MNLPQLKIFLKKLFIQQDDVFPYPEISAEEFGDLNQMVEPIEKFFTEESKNAVINEKNINVKTVYWKQNVYWL